MSLYFGDQGWPQLQEAITRNTLILLPIGQVEQHGPHLPVSTDSTIATGVGRAVAEAVCDEIPVLVMPTVWTGYSMKDVARWPGTMRVRPRVVMDLVHDICASLIEMGFRKIVLLDCHGNHGGILNVVVREIGDNYGVHMALTSPAGMSAAAFCEIRRSGVGGALHACEWETSLMLYFDQLVDMTKATDQDHFRTHSPYASNDMTAGGRGVYWSTWARQRSETGVYGDPTVASAETGAAIMQAIVDEYRKFLREFYEFELSTMP